MTKAELYDAVAVHRARTFHPVAQDLLCIQRACQNQLGLQVETHHIFQTPGLRGAAFIKAGVICLDAKLSPERMRFYCAHEAYHFLFHSGHMPLFNCFDEGHPSQNDYLEWQANEAAAETLIPYHSLLAQLQAAAPRIHTGQHYHTLAKDLAAHFGVTIAMVKTRFNSLKYEVVQMLSGTPIDKLRLLSDRQQARENINVLSLNEVYPDIHVQYPLPKLGRILSA